MKRKLNKRGFTLAELLIVVAILAILIAVAIPVYTSALHDAQIRVNTSNARALKGAAVAQILSRWTQDDGAGKKYSEGIDNGWHATACFDEKGNMTSVQVQVCASDHKSVTTDYVGTATLTDSGTSAPTLGTGETVRETSVSGDVPNTNYILVHIQKTDLNN